MTIALDKNKDFFDADTLRNEFKNLTTSFNGDGSSFGIRNQILIRLKEFKSIGRKIVEERLLKSGKGRPSAQMLSHLQDEIIRLIYNFAVNHVYRVANPSTSERMTVVAVGGFGRGTLAPESDLDLLFILPNKQTPWGESVTEYILHLLWDIGLKVGHSTRNINECIFYSKSDMTVRTAILEARYICGDQELYDQLLQKFKLEIVNSTKVEFIQSKLAERNARHRAHGESRYLVEPNVKEGKGGLRDLNTLFWICKYVYQINNYNELVKAGVFSQSELNRFRKCEDFLWAVRCMLHFATGRPKDRLTFDIQRKIAVDLNYTPYAGLNDVERFMKHYFLVAKDVGDLTRILCATLEEQHIKQTPYLSRFIEKLQIRRKDRAIKGYPDFKIENQRINIVNHEVFKKDPVNLIRMFFLAGSKNLILHPDAVKIARRSRKLIDSSLRKNETANQLFLKILTNKDDPETILRSMNETGILGRFVPEFGKIVAMMQFSSYHHYTVDEHLLRSVGVLSEIERGEMDAELPLSSKLIGEIENRNALYVAVFLHDIAKGRKEDHSIAGARIAEKFCPRFGMDHAETELVAWLIRNHLEMSTIAQTRDIQDAKTIENFVEIVQSPERLKLLLILTAADIKAVGPGVFTGWKGQLLRTLYNETEPILSGGHTELTQDQKVENAKTNLIERLKGWSKSECKSYINRLYPNYWIRENLESQVKHAGLFKKIDNSKKQLVTMISTHEFEANTKITVLAPDHPRLLTMITGACVKAEANIVDSQIYTTSDGLALDTIAISRKFKDELNEQQRAERIINFIEKLITGQEYLQNLVKKYSKSKNFLSNRAFSRKTNVLVTNSWSNKFTVIEISGLDRPGLLFDLTNAISDLNLNISSAHISTYGERAVDVFYVTDMTGQKITNQTRQKKIKSKLISEFNGTEMKSQSVQSPAGTKSKKAG